MAEETYQKIDIAHEYLDVAMQLYVEKRNLFCAIHLAAAAEGLFGAYLPKEQRISQLAIKAQIGMQAIHTGVEPKEKEVSTMLNRPKNKIKHMDSDDDSTLLIDPAFEANRWIEGALVNLGNLPEKLKRTKSVTQWKYEDYINGKTSG